MKSYNPSFQDRIAHAAKAKQKALDNLHARPALDEDAVAKRQATRLKREARESNKRAAKKAAEQAAKDEKAAARAEAAAKVAAIKPPRTEAERKLARDARYAARKNRK
jgi:hypothetical protein